RIEFHSRQTWIGDNDAALVVAVEFGGHFRQRGVVEHEHVLPPGNLVLKRAFGLGRDRYPARGCRCDFAGLEYRKFASPSRVGGLDGGPAFEQADGELFAFGMHQKFRAQIFNALTPDYDREWALRIVDDLEIGFAAIEPRFA